MHKKLKTEWGETKREHFKFFKSPGTAFAPRAGGIVSPVGWFTSPLVCSLISIQFGVNTKVPYQHSALGCQLYRGKSSLIGQNNSTLQY